MALRLCVWFFCRSQYNHIVGLRGEFAFVVVHMAFTMPNQDNAARFHRSGSGWVYTNLRIFTQSHNHLHIKTGKKKHTTAQNNVGYIYEERLVVSHDLDAAEKQLNDSILPFVFFAAIRFLFKVEQNRRASACFSK